MLNDHTIKNAKKHIIIDTLLQRFFIIAKVIERTLMDNSNYKNYFGGIRKNKIKINVS